MPSARAFAAFAFAFFRTMNGSASKPQYDGYASDITRTFPADGRFTPAQRELYDIVLEAQQAAVAATRPGARKQDAHWAAVRVLAQGMLDSGLLNRDKAGDVDAVMDELRTGSAEVLWTDADDLPPLLTERAVDLRHDARADVARPVAVANASLPSADPSLAASAGLLAISRPS